MCNSFELLDCNVYFATNFPKTNYLTYVSDNYGIAIRYPNDWSYEEFVSNSNDTSISVVEIVPPLSDDPEILTSVHIGIKKLSRKITIDHYARTAIKHYREIHKSNFNLISAGQSLLYGQLGYEIIFGYTERDRVMVYIEIGTIFRGKLYYIEFVTQLSKYAHFLPMVHKNDLFF